MRHLTADFIISLDGYGAAEGWPGWWGMEGPEYLAWLDTQQEHTHLMGATTYRMFAEFADQLAGDTSQEASSVTGLTEHPTVVFSSTLDAPLSWPNAELVTDDAAEAVRAKKQQAGRPMRTIGSLSLCRSLLTAGVVDRFRVVVFPVITGATGQERIFDGYPDLTLDLVESRTFDGRIQLLEYVPTVVDGPPAARG